MLTRRTLLKSGGVATAMTMSGIVPGSQAYPLAEAWGGDFLTPWSPRSEMARDLTAGQTPVRLSCSAYGLHYEKGMDIGSRVKEIRDAGYTAAEANDSWKEATDSDIRELHDALNRHDLMFYTLHLCVNNIHPDLSVRRDNIRRVTEMVETASRLGHGFVVSHTGSCATDRPTHPHRDNWTRETWKTSVNSLRQILKDTSGSGVDLAIEALNPCNINNPYAHVRLREDVGDPRIKVTLDPQNMINPATYYRTSELVNLCFDLIGEDICYAHAKDVAWEPEMLPSFSWVVAGTGTMDFETYLIRLSRLKTTRPLLLEFLPAEKYPEARNHIISTARSVGVSIYS